MPDEIYSSEEEFRHNCPCAYSILRFIDNIQNTDTRWFFDVGYAFYEDKRYSIIFKSYITEGYEDYILSIEAVRKNGSYDIRIFKKVDNLLNDSV